MHDGKASTRDIYHYPRALSGYGGIGSDDAGMDELVEALRARGDNGLPFWHAVREALGGVPDRPHLPLPTKKPLPVGQVVYYLRFADRVKIGTTANLASRLQQIPYDEVLATEPGDRDLEMYRHGQFSAERVVGEWFTLSDRLRDHIANL